MKTIKVLAPALVGLLSAGVAHAAEPVGIVSEASGDVLVLRGNQTVAANAGDQVFAGDRVITRSGATANVSAYGCSSALADAAMVTVSETLCTTSAVGYSSAAATAAPLIPLLAGPLAGAAIVTAAIVTAVVVEEEVNDDDDDDDDGGENPVPVSP